MILQTAGSATNVKNDIGCDNRLVDARDAMFRAVDRANLTVHSLDPSGLVNFNPITRASSPLRGRDVAAASAAAANDNVQRQGNLHVLPDRTGGRALMNSNEPDLFVPEIFRESDSYYLIGFRPADPSPNGAFHKITVKTTRRDIDVHARSGYTAGAAAAPAGAGSAAVSEPVREALTGLLPASTTPVSMQSATFAVPDARTAAVVLTVGVDAFAATRRGCGGGARRAARDRGQRLRSGRAPERPRAPDAGALVAGIRGRAGSALRRALASRPAAGRIRDSCRGVAPAPVRGRRACSPMSPCRPSRPRRCRCRTSSSARPAAR